MAKKKIDKEKNPVGRPTDYKDEYCEQIVEYFKKRESTVIQGVIIPPELPLLCAWADSVGVSEMTALRWCKKYPKFSEAYARAKSRQKNQLVQNGLNGNYSGSFVNLAAKNIINFRDKIETDSVTVTATTELTEEERIKALERVKIGLKEFDDYE